MSKVPFFLESPKKQFSAIYFSTKVKGGGRLRLSLGVSVETKFWDAAKRRARMRKEYPDYEAINQQLDSWETLIAGILDDFRGQLTIPTNETFRRCIDGKLSALSNNINNVHKKSEGITDIFYRFISERRISARRVDALKVVVRAFKRFELYKKRSFTLGSVTETDIAQFERFLVEEHSLYKAHPAIYKAVPETRVPAKRGKNRIALMLKILSSLFNQAVDKKLIAASPLAGYVREQEVYGTPFYITIEERDLLYTLDLSGSPALAVQRDIFVFQCLVGCRVGDLLSMTKDSLIDGAIEYIARKTKDDKPLTVRVPLSKKAKEILSRYPEVEGGKLLPFIASQRYNDAIKEAFTKAGLTRMVTILDPLTRKEVKKPLNEVASSHLARRTFIGNLYKKVKDPSLIGSMLGHAEGSKAFARYRAIDDEIKKGVIDEYLD